MYWGEQLDTSVGHRSSTRPRALAFVPAGALVAAGVLLFGSTGRDDAYITYWPAQTLARSGEILSYNGDRFEQSSSLLHTLVLALVSKVTTISVPAAGWLVGVVGGVAVVALAVVIAERVEHGAGWRAGLLAATGAYLVYWSFGGLETSLATASFLLALLAVDAVVRRSAPWWLGALGVSPYVLARPEAPAIIGVVCAGAIGVERLSGRADTNRALRVIAAAAVAVLVVVAFRVAYFGDVVPQPVHTKVTGLRVGDGLRYARHWLVRPDTLLLLGFTVYSLTRRQRSTLETLLWMGAAAQLGFVVVTGGDWMEAGRFLVSFVSVIAILAGVGVTRIGARPMVLAVLLAGQVLGLGLVARADSTGRPLWARFNVNPARVAHVDLPWYEAANRVHTRDGAFEPILLAAIDAVHQETGRPVVVASGQAGMVMYDVLHARPGVVRFIDRGRLSGDAFGHCPGGLVDSPFGRVMPYSYWFTHADACKLPLPDVVFDLGDGTAAGLGSQFVVTDVLRSPRIIAKGRLRGAPTDATEFVAIRADLAAAHTR